jgi:hypothetical protein
LIALGEASGAGEYAAERDFGLESLVAAVRGASTPLRPWAALGLGLQQRLRRARGHADSVAATQALLEALREARSAYSTGAFALALGLAGDAVAIEPLADRLAHTSEPGARGYVCLGLGLLEARAHAASIAEVARTARSQPALLSNAALALGLLGDRDDVLMLAQMFATSSSSTTHAGLASALGMLGDVRALDPLLALARDETRPALVRAFAIVALGGLADGRKRPWNEPLAVGTDYLCGVTSLASPKDGRGVLDLY